MLHHLRHADAPTVRPNRLRLVKFRALRQTSAAGDAPRNTGPLREAIRCHFVPCRSCFHSVATRFDPELLGFEQTIRPE